MILLRFTMCLSHVIISDGCCSYLSRLSSCFCLKRIGSVRAFLALLPGPWRNMIRRDLLAQIWQRSPWRTCFAVKCSHGDPFRCHFWKIRKSMPKESPKVMFFGPKTDLQRPRVHWFCNLGKFLRMRKISDFSMPLWVSKKCPGSSLPWKSGRWCSPGVPREPPFRAQFIGFQEFIGNH